MTQNVPLQANQCRLVLIISVFLLGLASNPLFTADRFIPSCMAQSTSAVTGVEGTIVPVRVGKGNLRAQPDINALVIDQITAGTRLRLVENRHPWYQIELQDGRRGWVHASVLNFDAATKPRTAPPAVGTKAPAPGPHTHYTVNVATARVRKEPSVQSDIVFRLRQGDIVRVNGIQQDWFLIQDAKTRSGWANQRLFTPAKQSEMITTASPTVIKSVRHARGSHLSEKILFDLTGFHPPQTFTLNGNRPRLVCDFKNAQLGPGIKPRIPANGILIKDIRVAYHPGPAAKVRVVLDLLPDRAYEVEQIYYKQESRFYLILKSK